MSADPSSQVHSDGGAAAAQPQARPTDDIKAIYEEEAPGQSDVLRPSPGGVAHPDNVRMWLAVSMVAILALIVLSACWGWARGATVDDMQALAIVLSPVVTLVGTILGFYFSSERPSKIR